MNRRDFLGTASLAAAALPAELPRGSYSPGRIANEYSLRLSGEQAALNRVPSIRKVERGFIEANSRVKIGEFIDGWQLLATARMNGTVTAVLEKTVTHGGCIAYVTESEGVILRVEKQVGRLSAIRPRPVNTPHGIAFRRQVPFVPGPDRPGEYILHSNEDPCYENVAALGAEYIGYSLVGGDGCGPLQSLFLTGDGSSRQLADQPEARWAPDLVGKFFDPANLLPGDDPSLYRYMEGFSKRTLLGGYLPIAHTGVWNPQTKCGYEAIVVLPRDEKPEPVGLLRATVPEWMVARLGSNAGNVYRHPDGTYMVERYWRASPDKFWEAVAGAANYWQHFFDDHMAVRIPDPWLLDAARAGIVLSRCSYRGLEPTYQVGEGIYTKIPERSHALFPVAFYEFIWTHQLWNLTAECDPHFQNYLDRYILPDGNFLYNTQDQVEAPMNVGVFLWNSARAYDYTHDVEALRKRLPSLRRMIGYVLGRYEYSKTAFPETDRRHGLIWGSPEADLGAPANDFPNSHPFYFQNSVWIWRGLREHSRCLASTGDNALKEESARLSAIAAEMRGLIERSLTATIAAGTEEMRRSGITPFSPDDVRHDPKQLSSYENHRFMMDWFTADWGVPALDRGHLEHRRLAGHEIMGLHTDADLSRTSNFMEHGTLAARIREDDYRPFLLTLYSLCCYAADSGNRYSPEDAYIPGGRPGEGNPYLWSSVVNSVLQPTLGLRWLLCYEESNADVCHLQKAAPKHWFAAGQTISVEKCPTRFGSVSWSTRATSNTSWTVTIQTSSGFSGDLAVHIHPPGGGALRTTAAGRVEGTKIVFPRGTFSSSSTQTIDVTSA